MTKEFTSHSPPTPTHQAENCDANGGGLQLESLVKCWLERREGGRKQRREQCI